MSDDREAQVGGQAPPPRFPEREHYGCVDCGSMNHTTGDVAWCQVAQEAAAARTPAGPRGEEQ